MTKEWLISLLIPPFRSSFNSKIGSETQLCIQFANWLREQSLTNDFPYIWMHVPNEFRAKTKMPLFGVMLSWMGKIIGAPDYIFMGMNDSFVIEFKVKKGKQTESQKNFQKWCEKVKVPYYLCFSSEEGQEAILKHWRPSLKNAMISK